MSTLNDPNKPPCMTIDANVLIAICSKEIDKYDVAIQELTICARAGYIFYAPGVIIAESLYVLCKKLEKGLLSPVEHAEAVEDLSDLMSMIQPPPHGEGSLVKRAEEIRAGYGCSRSADGVYIALTEKLGESSRSELLTFDAYLLKQAEKTSPSTTIRFLPTIKSL